MLVHFNGQLVPHEQVRVSPFDRGFLFGDAIYEGLRSFAGHIVGMTLHGERMRRGLAEARIGWDAEQLGTLARELADANGLSDAFVYWQVTRGVPSAGQPLRSRVPSRTIIPTVFGYCLPAPALSTYTTPPTKSAITTRDARWLRGLVKSTSLLGNVISSLEASEAGADDAILIRDGLVAEGSSANLVAVVPDGREGWEVVTPSLDSTPILAGVTRDLILRAVNGTGGLGAGASNSLRIVERGVTVDELHQASEIMLLGTLTMVTAVTTLDHRRVGDGGPGPVAEQLLQTLVNVINAEASAHADRMPRGTGVRN